MQDLSRHLKEAIEINKARMPKYGELSEGATITYSKKLIRLEKIALWGAWYFDKRGDALQKLGIPYLKAEFIEMSLTPEFSSSYPEGINYKRPIQKINIHPFSETINADLKSKNYLGITSLCETLLEKLKEQEHVYCMTRHLVESLGRIAYLIPLHQVRCQIVEVKDPTKYSHFLLQVHHWALNQAMLMDESIATIQNKGIPFLYQDFPKIEIRSSYD